MQGPRRGAARAYREASLPLSYKYRGAKVGFRSAYQDTHGQTHTHKPRRGVRGRRSQTVKLSQTQRQQTLADPERGSGGTEACSSRWAPRESNHCLALASVYG
jgi:hypothetical protein